MTNFAKIYRVTALILLNTLMLLCVLEVVLGIVRMVHREHVVKRFVVENWATLSKAYPTRSQEEVIRLRLESGKADLLVYAPWVQFSMAPIKGQFFNSNGLRRGFPASYNWATAKPDGKHFDVYFFGNSAMFGSGVSDEETLPAQFERLAPRGWRTRAFNYGQPYYYSRQETLLFEQLLRNGERPTAAVFLDGPVDAVAMTASYLREPFFTPLLQRRMTTPIDFSAFLQDLNLVKALKISGVIPAREHAAYSYFNTPAGIPMEVAVGKILENYLENLQFTQVLCRTYKVQCFFVWQPVPNVDYKNEADTVAEKGANPKISMLYEMVRTLKSHPSGFVDLSGALKDFPGQPFVDSFHYSGPFMATLAERLLLCVTPVEGSQISRRC